MKYVITQTTEDGIKSYLLGSKGMWRIFSTVEDAEKFLAQMYPDADLADQEGWRVVGLL